MKYTVKKNCDWQGFSGKKGQTLTAAEMLTADGSPVPQVVIDTLVRMGCLVPVTE